MEIHQLGIPYPNLPFNFGVGVDIFFVVSGFVMGFTIITSKQLPTPREFARRRIARVVPLYWFYTAAMLLAILLIPQTLNNSSTSFGLIFCSYAFIPCLNDNGEYLPVLSLGWTLNYEMFFYAIVATSLLAREQWAKVVILSIAASISLSVLIGGFWSFWGNPIIVEFLFGILIAKLYVSKNASSNTVIILLSIASIIAIYISVWNSSESRLFRLGVPAIIFCGAVILLWPMQIPENLRVISRFIGDSSYSLYLSHPFVLAISKIIWSKIDPHHFNPTVFLLSSLLACILIARISYIYFEIPITRAILRPQINEPKPAA